jgi:hypothetical protein
VLGGYQGRIDALKPSREEHAGGGRG